MTSSKIAHDDIEIHAATVRPLLVNIAQAAEILCISRTTLYELTWRGQLRPIHIGRSVRFALEQLEHFVEERIRSDCATDAFEQR